MLFRLLLLVAAVDQEPGFSIRGEGEYWYATPTGQLMITLGSRPGSGNIGRVGEDFGLKSTGIAGAEAGASWGDHRVRLSYLDLRFRGEDELDDTLIFHGTTYPQGEKVTSRIDFPRLSFGYDYDVWNTTWTKTWVGLVGHVYWFSARLTGDTQDEVRSYSRGGAALTTSIEAFPGPVRVAADGSLGYSTSSHQLFGGVRLTAEIGAWGRLALGLGYRWERMDASGGTNVAALTLHGPTAFVTLRF